jgi:hypothetical protein
MSFIALRVHPLTYYIYAPTAPLVPSHPPFPTRYSGLPLLNMGEASQPLYNQTIIRNLSIALEAL